MGKKWTSCVIDLFHPAFKSQLMLLCNFFGYCQSHHDNLHLSLVTAYWRLIILSWANSRLRSIAEYFAKNSLLSFGKKFCKQFASLIWQNKSLSRANFAFFASLNICKIILNVCSAHYLQIMLAHKLGPSLVFLGCLTLFYLSVL